MKHTFKLLLAIALASTLFPAYGRTADKGHRVVFEVTSDGKEAWDSVLNNVENVKKSLGPDIQIEVVVHGKGLGMLLNEANPVKERLQSIAGKQVVFAACENTMKRKNVTREQLVPLAITVDSGVAEVVRKQEAGWSYVRSGG